MARLIQAIRGAWKQSRPAKPRGLRGVLFAILRVLFCVYVGLCALLMVFQSRLIYRPYRRLECQPDELNLPYEDAFFRTDDGLTLHGWFVPADNPRGTVLFCHGNAGNISHRIYSLDVFNRLGLDVLIFDYRGYGRSEGSPSEAGTAKDAEAAWRYLVEDRNVAPQRLIVFGRSLGGAVAARLARDRSPAAAIVESSFTSVPDLGQQMMPFLPVRLIMRYDYNALEYVSRLDCPVLVVHSRQDDMIPFSHGRKLFAAAGEPKEFLEIQGSHNDGFMQTGPAYVDGLDAFLTRHFGPRLRGRPAATRPDR